MEKIAREKIGNGDQVTVITWKPWTGWGSWHPVKTVEDGVAVYRFWVPNIFSYKSLAKHNFVLKLIWHFIDIFNCFSARIIKKILEQEKSNEVQTHNLVGIGFFVPRVIQRLGIKHTHYLHDVQLVEPSGVLPWNHERESLLQKIYSWIMKWRMGKPDAVLSPSKFLAGFYKEGGFFVDSPYHIITSSHHHTILDNERQARNPTTFLFVGSLVEHKGIRVLMKAWDEVDKNAQVELRIVGDGVLKKEVEEWARKDERVEVYGRLGGKELEGVYKKSDILIFPSICIENHPTVIDEAHRFGLRVIASDTGGVGEMVREGDVLVRPEDVKRFGGEIEKLLNC